MAYEHVNWCAIMNNADHFVSSNETVPFNAARQVVIINVINKDIGLSLWHNISMETLH